MPLYLTNTTAPSVRRKDAGNEAFSDVQKIWIPEGFCSCPKPLGFLQSDDG
jgi:hypothetical protein